MNVYPTAIPDHLYERLNKLSERKWFEEPASLPDKDTLKQVADEAYQASLLTEERRRPGFRLIYCSPDDLSSGTEERTPNPPRVVRLPTPRPYTSGGL